MKQLHSFPKQAEIFVSKKRESSNEGTISHKNELGLLQEMGSIKAPQFDIQADTLHGMKFQTVITDSIKLRLVREAMKELILDQDIATIQS